MKRGLRSDSVQHRPTNVTPIGFRAQSLQVSSLRPASKPTGTIPTSTRSKALTVEDKKNEVPRSPSSSPRQPGGRGMLPGRRDSSIGATSMNPKIRRTSVLTVAAMNKPPKHEREPINFEAPESKEAMKKLQTMFNPVLLRYVLKKRERKRWKVFPPREYTIEAVIKAIIASKCPLSEWPIELLEQICSEAVFKYYKPKDVLVYAGEPHVSSGLVVLLYGQVSEKRKDITKGHPHHEGVSSPNRPVKSQKQRTRYSPDVLCVQSVLCEDRNATSIKAAESVDVAVISSRWIWEMINSFVLESSKAPMLLERFRQTVIPNRTEMMLSYYYATSVLLMRSWMWPFLSGSDRVKLARSMEVKVLNIGDALFEEGSLCPYIYFLRRGSLTVVVKGEPLAIVEPGAAFGEVSVVFSEARNCSVVAGSICELYALHGNELYHRFKKYPDLIKLITYKALERRQTWLADGKLRDVFSLVSILGGVPCLSHTTESMREELAKRAQTRTVPAGYMVVRQNKPCTDLFVIGRGAVRVGGKRNPSSPTSCLPGEGEGRSVGDYFGELFLRAHLSPLDVVSETSVDLWVLSKADVLEVLDRNKAQAQAEEVCRQGVSLYKTQHGENSIVEGYELPVAALGSSTGGGGRRGSAGAGRTSSASAASVRRASLTSTSKRSAVEEEEDALEGYDWPGYVKEKTVSKEEIIWRATQRELRNVDKATEKVLRNKVQALISVPPNLPPNSADCDFPGEVNELQAIIVEQLLLTPTEEQPRFLKQINDSNLRLITEDGIDEYEEPEPEVHIEDLGAADEFVPVAGITEIEEIGSATTSEDEDDEKERSMPFKSMPAAVEDNSFDRSVSNFINGSLQLGTYGRLGSPGRKQSLALEESSGAFPNLNARPSISRSHLVRPPSGLPSTSDARSPRNSIQRPISASEQLILATQHRVRPASVDYSQQGKVNAEKSVSALDRFVKIEDKNYFNSVVKMLPLQEGEMWIPDEEVETGPLMLMLLHVRSCAKLKENVVRSGAAYIMKVVKNGHVLLTTSVQLGSSNSGGTFLRWPVSLASFVKFIHQGVELVFRLMGAEDKEETVLYEGTFQTSQIGDKGGMGRCLVQLHDMKDNGEDGDSDVEDVTTGPHLTLVILAVMASNYKGLQHRLEMNASQTIAEVAEDSVRRHAPSHITNFNEAHLQILAVESLKHRIDASMRVTCIGTNGLETLLLQTPHVVPKTRNPCWCADGAYLALQSEGVIKFELFHKDQPIGSYRTSLDDVVFGGEGIRRFPLAAAHIEEPLGTLVVHVVNTSASTKVEDRRSEKVLLLHVQELKVKNEEDYPLPPDLFAVVRQASGDGEILRTPLRFGQFCTTYTMEEASCLLLLPTTAGSSASYSIEIFDSDERTLIADSCLTVTSEGLGPDNHYIIPMGAHVQAQVHTALLSVWDTATLQRPAVPHEEHFKRDMPLTVVHVKRCSFPDLQDPDNVLRTEALATLWCAGFECLRTSARDFYNTSPFAWELDEASVVLRVDPTEMTEGAILSLYDGLIDAADLVGEVTLPTTDLVRTGEFTYPVYPLGAQSQGKGRSRGTVTVRTLCGRINSAIMPPGASISAPAAGEALSAFYSTALLASSDTLGYRRTPATQVRFSVTNVCQVLPKAASKTVVVELFVGSAGVLTVEQPHVEGPSAAWDLEQGSTIMNVRDFPCEIRVKVSAMDVRQEMDTDSKSEIGASVPDAFEATMRQPQQSQSKRRVVVGETKVTLTAVGANETRMFVVPLDATVSAVTVTGEEREAKILPPLVGTKTPVLSFFVKGIDKNYSSV